MAGCMWSNRQTGGIDVHGMGHGQAGSRTPTSPPQCRRFPKRMATYHVLTDASYTSSIGYNTLFQV